MPSRRDGSKLILAATFEKGFGCRGNSGHKRQECARVAQSVSFSPLLNKCPLKGVSEHLVGTAAGAGNGDRYW